MTFQFTLNPEVIAYNATCLFGPCDSYAGDDKERAATCVAQAMAVYVETLRQFGPFIEAAHEAVAEWNDEDEQATRKHRAASPSRAGLPRGRG